MFTHLLILSAVITLIIYQINTSQGYLLLNNIQYGAIFLVVFLVLYWYNNMKKNDLKTSLKTFVNDLNLVDNDKVKEVIGDSNGKTKQPCYMTPYKVIKTQYGDRGLLAGYNEMVEAYNQGGLDYESPENTSINKCAYLQK